MRFELSVTVEVDDYEDLENKLSSLTAVGGKIREIRCQQNGPTYGILPIPEKYTTGGNVYVS